MVRLAWAGVFAVVAGGAVAHAGPFGGFSADGSRYLHGKNQVCVPLAAKAASNGVSMCERADAGEIADATFRMGTRQSSAAREFRAEGGGTRIKLFAPGESRPMMKWDAGGVVSRVTDVWASENATLVAVQFESRRLGRAQTDVLVVRVADAPARAEPTRAKPAADASVDRAAADAALSNKQWKRAETLYRVVLAADPADLAARYGLAVALARRKKHREALRELRTLAKANRDKAIPLLVDARTHKAFKKLRKKPQFRRAVGLDRAAGDEVTAYERLLDGKGRWETPHVACEEAGIKLRLRRKPATFTLKITDECKGMTDTMNLDGRWDSVGTTTLTLTFPNEGGLDDTTTCEVSGCNDGSGEDCLQCTIDRDLAFTLRPDRR